MRRLWHRMFGHGWEITSIDAVGAYFDLESLCDVQSMYYTTACPCNVTSKRFMAKAVPA